MTEFIYHYIQCANSSLFTQLQQFFMGGGGGGKREFQAAKLLSLSCLNRISRMLLTSNECDCGPEIYLNI